MIDRPRRGRGGASNAEETRKLLLDAALRSLATRGYAGTTARSIAADAGTNASVINYHFGGIANLLVAALERSNQERLARYRQATAQVTSASELVATWQTLHAEDVEVGHVAAMVALIGASSAVPGVNDVMAAAFQPWLDLAEEKVTQAVAGNPLGSLVPPDQAAFVILSLFVGIEVLGNLDGYEQRADDLFRTARSLAALVPAGLLGALGGGTTP